MCWVIIAILLMTIASWQGFANRQPNSFIKFMVSKPIQLVNSCRWCSMIDFVMFQFTQRQVWATIVGLVITGEDKV